jgi:hypothetical protein
MPDKIQSFKLVCRGGLNYNENHLDLSENFPGGATRLVNYEPSMFGGYRRIEGFSPLSADFPNVGNALGEGRILCVAVFRNEHLGDPYIIAARKDTGVNAYSFWKLNPLTGWSKMTTGFTRLFTAGGRTVTKIRHVQFDFGTGSTIAFADGVNKAIVFNGTNWYQIASTGTGGPSSAGGDQAVNAPAIIDVFENHLFIGGDPTSNSLIVHSAPRDPLTFTAAAGAGQIPVGFKVVQFKPFRDNLFVFGSNGIKKVSPDVTAGFLLDQVTANVGCIARDSVMEIGGDLVFLAPDGIRPVAGTSRIGDVELETISKSIKGLVLDYIKSFNKDDLNGVVVRSKSQLRYFFGDDAQQTTNSVGIIGGLTDQGGSIGWEYGQLLGIRASCCTSEYIEGEEYVLHGDYDGVVYRQESGTTFNGQDIAAIYSTPYLDFGDTEIRKTLHKINTFIRAEGPFTMNISLSYDWDDSNTARPASYSQTSDGAPIVYGGSSITYGAGDSVKWGGSTKPVLLSDIQGSGFSTRATFVTIGDYEPYSIQGLVFEFAVAGRR